MLCWFQLPSEWLKIASFRRRAITVLLVHISSVLAVLFYIPSTYQPILAICLPIIREGFGLVMSALGKRSSGGDFPSVELIAGNIVALFHVLLKWQLTFFWALISLSIYSLLFVFTAITKTIRWTSVERLWWHLFSMNPLNLLCPSPSWYAFLCHFMEATET